ncbi:YdcF family protein [Azotosporobacter soli]|uniref:YdcF family protein n=1 Tax=Azotosporobacter soli TaxID=3055040 RepID=UPI0031FE5212
MLALLLMLALYGITFGTVATGCLGLALLGASRLFAPLAEQNPRHLRLLYRLQCVVFSGVILFLASLLIVEGFIYRAGSDDAKAKGPFLIVLGAAVLGDQPSVTLRGRLEKAVQYLHAHPEATTVVSGGLGRGKQYTEAEVMRRYLIERGVAAERIIMENRSTTTWENLRYSKILLQERADWDGSLVIITSDYHQFRAQYLAARLGIEASGEAVRSRPLLYLNYALREYFAVLKTFLLDR